MDALDQEHEDEQNTKDSLELPNRQTYPPAVGYFFSFCSHYDFKPPEFSSTVDVASSNRVWNNFLSHVKCISNRQEDDSLEHGSSIQVIENGAKVTQEEQRASSVSERKFNEKEKEMQIIRNKTIGLALDLTAGHFGDVKISGKNEKEDHKQYSAMEDHMEMIPTVLDHDTNLDNIHHQYVPSSTKTNKPLRPNVRVARRKIYLDLYDDEDVPPLIGSEDEMVTDCATPYESSRPFFHKDITPSTKEEEESMLAQALMQSLQGRISEEDFPTLDGSKPSPPEASAVAYKRCSETYADMLKKRAPVSSSPRIFLDEAGDPGLTSLPANSASGSVENWEDELIPDLIDRSEIHDDGTQRGFCKASDVLKSKMAQLERRSSHQDASNSLDNTMNETSQSVSSRPNAGKHEVEEEDDNEADWAGTGARPKTSIHLHPAPEVVKPKIPWNLTPIALASKSDSQKHQPPPPPQGPKNCNSQLSHLDRSLAINDLPSCVQNQSANSGFEQTLKDCRDTPMSPSSSDTDHTATSIQSLWDGNNLTSPSSYENFAKHLFPPPPPGIKVEFPCVDLSKVHPLNTKTFLPNLVSGPPPGFNELLTPPFIVNDATDYVNNIDSMNKDALNDAILGQESSIEHKDSVTYADVNNNSEKKVDNLNVNSPDFVSCHMEEYCRKEDKSSVQCIKDNAIAERKEENDRDLQLNSVENEETVSEEFHTASTSIENTDMHAANSMSTKLVEEAESFPKEKHVESEGDNSTSEDSSSSDYDTPDSLDQSNAAHKILHILEDPKVKKEHLLLLRNTIKVIEEDLLKSGSVKCSKLKVKNCYVKHCAKREKKPTITEDDLAEPFHEDSCSDYYPPEDIAEPFHMDSCSDYNPDKVAADDEGSDDERKNIDMAEVFHIDSCSDYQPLDPSQDSCGSLQVQEDKDRINIGFMHKNDERTASFISIFVESGSIDYDAAYEDSTISLDGTEWTHEKNSEFDMVMLDTEKVTEDVAMDQQEEERNASQGIVSYETFCHDLESGLKKNVHISPNVQENPSHNNNVEKNDAADVSVDSDSYLFERLGVRKPHMDETDEFIQPVMDSKMEESVDNLEDQQKPSENSVSYQHKVSEYRVMGVKPLMDVCAQPSKEMKCHYEVSLVRASGDRITVDANKVGTSLNDVKRHGQRRNSSSARFSESKSLEEEKNSNSHENRINSSTSKSKSKSQREKRNAKKQESRRRKSSASKSELKKSGAKHESVRRNSSRSKETDAKSQLGNSNLHETLNNPAGRRRRNSSSSKPTDIKSEPDKSDVKKNDNCTDSSKQTISKLHPENWKLYKQERRRKNSLREQKHTEQVVEENDTKKMKFGSDFTRNASDGKPTANGGTKNTSHNQRYLGCQNERNDSQKENHSSKPVSESKDIKKIDGAGSVTFKGFTEDLKSDLPFWRRKDPTAKRCGRWPRCVYGKKCPNTHPKPYLSFYRKDWKVWVERFEREHPVPVTKVVNVPLHENKTHGDVKEKAIDSIPDKAVSEPEETLSKESAPEIHQEEATSYQYDSSWQMKVPEKESSTITTTEDPVQNVTKEVEMKKGEKEIDCIEESSEEWDELSRSFNSRIGSGRGRAKFKPSWSDDDSPPICGRGRAFLPVAHDPHVGKDNQQKRSNSLCEKDGTPLELLYDDDH